MYSSVTAQGIISKQVIQAMYTDETAHDIISEQVIQAMYTGETAHDIISKQVIQAIVYIVPWRCVSCGFLLVSFRIFYGIDK